MRHNFVGNILYATILVAALTSCENPLVTENNADADASIETYIEGKGWTYTKENGVYHVTTAPTYSYEVNYGDQVTFMYVAQTFKKSFIFDTNIKSIAKANNLDTTIRSFDPLTVVMGEDNLLEGLHYGLLMCRMGQTSSIYFNSSFAYGDGWFGVVPPWSSLVFDVQIVGLTGEGIDNEMNALSNMNLEGFTYDSLGFFYRFNNDTVGVTPQLVDTVYAWYQCSLPDGTTIETSDEPNTQIIVSESNTAALKEGLLIMSSGRTASIVAPSPMGYGKKGNEKVDPYQTLLYEIRLDSIK